MVEHTRPETGFFNHCIAGYDRPGPSQINVIRLTRPASQNDTGIRRVIGDCIADISRGAGIRINS